MHSRYKHVHQCTLHTKCISDHPNNERNSRAFRKPFYGKTTYVISYSFNRLQQNQNRSDSFQHLFRLWVFVLSPIAYSVVRHMCHVIQWHCTMPNESRYVEKDPSQLTRCTARTHSLSKTMAMYSAIAIRLKQIEKLVDSFFFFFFSSCYKKGRKNKLERGHFRR